MISSLSLRSLFTLSPITICPNQVLRQCSGFVSSGCCIYLFIYLELLAYTSPTLFTNIWISLLWEFWAPETPVTNLSNQYNFLCSPAFEKPACNRAGLDYIHNYTYAVFTKQKYYIIQRKHRGLWYDMAIFANLKIIKRLLLDRYNNIHNIVIITYTLLELVERVGGWPSDHVMTPPLRHYSCRSASKWSRWLGLLAPY